MSFEQTWRWFGPNDPITLKEIKQVGVTGIVNALHQIPVGEVWTIDEIKKRKTLIEAEGFTWSVVESLPVSEDIKKNKGNYKQHIENYKQSIRNLSACGVKTICYNFMPVLDWSRTDLNVIFRDGSITTRFEYKAFAAFDLFILQRSGAEQEYSEELIKQAKKYFDGLNEEQKTALTKTVLYGLPGSLQEYTMKEFRNAIYEYNNEITEDVLRDNLYSFIKEIIPVVEEENVFMTIHPDDPPWSLLGLPRIVSTKDDLVKITGVIDSPSNGLTLCTGSLGAGYNNDLEDIAETLAHRVNFLHLRNVTRTPGKDFMEDTHLEGEINIPKIMKTLIMEQQKRVEQGRKDISMPIRPDHGTLMIPEWKTKGIYPGYSLMGRMRGLAELRGLETGIRHSLNL